MKPTNEPHDPLVQDLMTLLAAADDALMARGDDVDLAQSALRATAREILQRHYLEHGDEFPQNSQHCGTCRDLERLTLSLEHRIDNVERALR